MPRDVIDRDRWRIIMATLVAVFMTNIHAQSVAVSRLYTDDADTTRFADEEMPWRGDARRTTELLPASQIGFLRLPAGSRSGWHPAPRKQYVMVLEGTMEVEAGDGERRVFEAGSVLLVTDTTGRGHRTNVLSDEDVFLVWVPVP